MRGLHPASLSWLMIVGCSSGLSGSPDGGSPVSDGSVSDGSLADGSLADGSVSDVDGSQPDGSDGSMSGGAFVPSAGCSISTTSNYADTAQVTVTCPPGSFGTKPNGAKAYYVWKFYAGQASTDSVTSRNAFTGTLNGGAVTGTIVSSNTAPGSASALKADMTPFAADVFTGNVVSGGYTLSNVTPWPAHIAMGLTVEDTGSVLPPNCQVESFDKAAATITFGGQYAGPATKTGNNLTFGVSWAADCVFPQWHSGTLPSLGQDQTFAFRGMFNFPERSGDFSRQNHKFVRSIHGAQDLDFYLINWNGLLDVNELVIDSQSLGGTAAESSTQGAGWTPTPNKYFQHVFNYHGNSVASGTDGFLNWVADGVSQFPAAPTQKRSFWGTGGDNPAWWEWGDVATRPLLPQSGDAMWGDFMYIDDSACTVFIGDELQFPLAWSDTQVTFEMHRKYLDATVGTGSLANLHLKVQKSDYATTDCGYFTAAAQ
jgi:hypothetical protein